MRVSAFTDSYLPAINGATYTVKLWKEGWNSGRGRMTVTYPDSPDYTPDEHEYPVRSLPFPFYDDVRLGTPFVSVVGGFARVLGFDGPRLLPSRLPDEVCDADIVHVHGPFSMGIAGASLALSSDIPLVVSYHTPTHEYVGYLTSHDAVERRLRRLNDWWITSYLDHADVVLTPSDEAASWVPADADVRVVRNGVDTEFFRPVDPSDLVTELGLGDTVVGYCGRHGYEKRLEDVVDAAPRLDADVVLVGDGPAHDDLIERSRRKGADVVFPGFLPRDRLPEFYSALDVFVFPSDSETEGVVALEATACGTPVVAADAGGLRETVEEGVNGYRYPPRDVDALVSTVERALGDSDELSENCLGKRDSVGVDETLDRLERIYSEVSR